MTYNYPPGPEVSARQIVEMSGSAGGRQLAAIHIADVMSSAMRSTTTYNALPGLTHGYAPHLVGMWN